MTPQAAKFSNVGPHRLSNLNGVRPGGKLKWNNLNNTELTRVAGRTPQSIAGIPV